MCQDVCMAARMKGRSDSFLIASISCSSRSLWEKLFFLLSLTELAQKKTFYLSSTLDVIGEKEAAFNQKHSLDEELSSARVYVFMKTNTFPMENLFVDMRESCASNRVLFMFCFGFRNDTTFSKRRQPNSVQSVELISLLISDNLISIEKAFESHVRVEWVLWGAYLYQAQLLSE